MLKETKSVLSRKSNRGKFIAGLTLMSSVGLSVIMGAPQAQAKQVAMGTAPVVITADYGSPGLTENFNPFGSGHLMGANYMYEPMYVVNSLNGNQVPWLATNYKWVNTTELVFTIRSGIKWSDGTSLSAADVAYTFNLLHKYPALDTNALWTSLKSVTASGNKVIFDFKTANVPDWNYIATTPIVNKAQFSKVKNPVTFTNPNPVVTGPYVMSSFTPTEYILKVNPTYWQRNKVHVPELDFVALTTNTITDMGLSQGKFDWGSVFVANQNKTFIARDPNHFFSWQPLSDPWALYVNLTQWPFNQLKFREAMAYAIDRTRIVNQGEYGYMAPAYQSILAPSLQPQWTSSALTKKYTYQYNPSKAAQLLAQMGLKKNSQGQLLGKDGKPLTFTLQTPAGWTDIIQDCQFISQDLGKLGITVNVITPSPSTTTNNMETGHFQMADMYTSGSVNPYFMYHSLLSGQETAPIGKIAPSNWERWNDPQTNSLLDAFSRTTDPQKQKQIMVQLQNIMLTQLPVVTLDYGVWWNQYTTLHYTNWPTAKNPYAAPSNFAWPDDLLVVTNLQPVK